MRACIVTAAASSPVIAANGLCDSSCAFGEALGDDVLDLRLDDRLIELLLETEGVLDILTEDTRAVGDGAEPAARENSPSDFADDVRRIGDTLVVGDMLDLGRTCTTTSVSANALERTCSP